MADQYRLTASARALLSDFSARESPGGRGVSRAMLLARTIADLAESVGVGEDHLAEALVLRNREHTGMAQW
jgi:predicted ATPase with chaperone activity